jgi:preprotein translocase subunit SecA
MARDKKIIKNYGKVADQIIALDSYMAGLTDEELGAKTNEFKERLASGDDLDNLLVEAYATVREAALNFNRSFPSLFKCFNWWWSSYRNRQWIPKSTGLGN